VRHQLRTENLYLFNAGLDVAYLATGLYLLEKSRNPQSARSANRWRGYGHSLLVQGSFLLLFDGFQYGAHHRHGRDLYPLLSRLSVGPSMVAVTLPLGRTPR
jgi:asparagine N-glycosylation enzyme membrane subunit Stt3